MSSAGWLVGQHLREGGVHVARQGLVSVHFVADVIWKHVHDIYNLPTMMRFPLHVLGLPLLAHGLGWYWIKWST